jgi:hypothetical protein
MEAMSLLIHKDQCLEGVCGIRVFCIRCAFLEFFLLRDTDFHFWLFRFRKSNVMLLIANIKKQVLYRSIIMILIDVVLF